MTRKQRSTIAALLALLGGGGLMAWIFLSDPPATINADGTLQYAFALADVQSGRIASRSGTVSFARNTYGGWDLTSPVRTVADAVAIEAALERMRSLTATPIEGTGTGATSLRAYELDRPIATIEVETKQGSFALLVGPKNELEDRHYVTDAARTRIYSAPTAFSWALERPIEAYRDHRVFAVGEGEVTFIEVAGTTTVAYRLEQTQGRWRVSGRDDRAHDADAGEVRRLLVTVSKRLRAIHFLSEDVPPEGGAALARFGLDPAWRIEVRTQSRTIKARLGRSIETNDESGDRPVMWLEGTTTLIEVPEWTPKDLSKSLDVLKNRTISLFSDKEARKLTLFSGANTFIFERAGPDTPWSLSGQARSIHQWLPRGIVNVASVLKVDRLREDITSQAQLRALELLPPRRRILVESSSGILADIALGKREGETILLRVPSGLVGTYGTRLDDLFPESESKLFE